MKKGLMIGLVILVIVVIAVFVLMNNNLSDNTINSTDSPAKIVDSNSQVSDNSNIQNVKTFDLIAKNWEFSPSSISVNQGDKVVLNIKSVDVTHGFKLADFGINKDITPGSTVKVEFTADKKGTFPFSCSVYCGSGHREMTGNLVVN